MVTIRCTQKLLRRLRSESSPAPSTTRLGDWYANLLFARPEQLVLCVSERTLLPVIVTARNGNRLGERLSQALRVILQRFGIRPQLIDAEVTEMESVAFGPTRNRRLLGTLNDFMYRLPLYLDEHPSLPLEAAALWLAGTPCGAIGYEFPDRLTRQLFCAASGPDQ